MSGSGPFFLGFKDYSMVDIYTFPHISRLFYLEKSMLHTIYTDLEFDRLPHLTEWF